MKMERTETKTNGRMSAWRTLLLAGTQFALAPAFAQSNDGWQDVFVCGGSAGKSFYFNGDGWVDDGIEKGTITLRRKGSDFDVAIGDVTGTPFTARGDGAVVVGREAAGTIQVVAVYPMVTVESYLFVPENGGKVRLAWTSTRQAGSVARASVFTSDCTRR